MVIIKTIPPMYSPIEVDLQKKSSLGYHIKTCNESKKTADPPPPTVRWRVAREIGLFYAIGPNNNPEGRRNGYGGLI